MATTPTQESSAANISPQRRLLVDQARQSWIRKLIDLSRRNNLLYFRPLKTGTLDLANAEREWLAAFLRGQEVSTNNLYSQENRDPVVRVVREISRRALANLEEKGLQTLFVAMGQATWPAMDGGRPIESPILLVPATLEARGSQSFHLRRNGAVLANLVLLHVFEQQFGVKITAEELVGKLQGDDDGESFDTKPVYEEIQARCSVIAGLEIKEFAVLGNFAFQKMAMVKDLQQREQELAAHDVVASIAGDSDARSQVTTLQSETDPRHLDQIPPDNEFNVLDADSSQQCAIADVLAGQNAVIHGPPGTGKSQTIANLIAGLAALGKRVLFVAEKRAALDVVLRRLDEVGLSHLAIDLHGADLSPKRVMQQVARTLESVRNAVPVDCDLVHQQLVDRRNRLNNHVRRLHEVRPATGKSVYEMEGALVRCHAKSETRWRSAELARLDARTTREIRDFLKEAKGFQRLFLRNDPSPWCGANLPDGNSVQQALDLVMHMVAEDWPKFVESLNAVVSHAKFREPGSMQQVREIRDLLAGLHGIFCLYKPELYQQNLESMLVDLSPGKAGGIGSAWAFCTDSKFRRARSSVLSLRKQGKTSADVLFSELSNAAAACKKWSALAQEASSPPPLPEDERHLKNLGRILTKLPDLAAFLPSIHAGCNQSAGSRDSRLQGANAYRICG